MSVVSLCRRRVWKRLLFGGSAFILCETLPWQKALGGTLLQPTMRWPRCGLQVSTVREAQPECWEQSSNAVDAQILYLPLNLFYCIYLLISKYSFSKSLFCFQSELMCEVHLPKSKHNSFKLMIFDLGKKLTLFSKCSLYERSSLLLFIVLSCISFNNELLCNDVTTM